MGSRSGKATRNIVLEVGAQIISYIFQFIIRTVFIITLGEVYLGINGVLTNVLSLLSLSELGFSTAFAVSLYEPLTKKDNEKLAAILSYFKKVYLVVGIVVLALGLCLTPFLTFIIKADISENLYIIFLLYLLSSCVTYFSASYTTFITAAQNGYVISIIKIVKSAVLLGLQIAALYNKDFYFYLIAIIISNIVGVVLCYIYFGRKYKHVNQIKPGKIDKETKQEIVSNTKASFFHKLGGVVLSSTDNIVISTFISISVVGYYSNYSLIIGIISTLFALAVNALAAFVGEINVISDNKTKSILYWRLSYINYVFTAISTVLLFALINPFINIWAGPKYVLSLSFVIVLGVQFYINSIRRITQVYNMSLGLYVKYQYFPLIEAALNIVISIALVKIIGLIGVILGTIISVMVCTFVAERHVLLKYAIESNIKTFIKYDVLFLTSTAAMCCIAMLFYSNVTISESMFCDFAIKTIIISTITIMVFLVGMKFTCDGRWWLNYIRERFLNRIINVF